MCEDATYVNAHAGWQVLARSFGIVAQDCDWIAVYWNHRSVIDACVVRRVRQDGFWTVILRLDSTRRARSKGTRRWVEASPQLAREHRGHTLEKPMNRRLKAVSVLAAVVVAAAGGLARAAQDAVEKVENSALADLKKARVGDRRGRDARRRNGLRPGCS